MFVNIGFAQQILKIGHVNTAGLISEHEKKVQKFEYEQETYSDFVRKTKESELMESAQKIQNFLKTAGQQLQKRNLELNQPVYQKLNAAISKVASRNSFTYILDYYKLRTYH